MDLLAVVGCLSVVGEYHWWLNKAHTSIELQKELVLPWQGNTFTAAKKLWHVRSHVACFKLKKGGRTLRRPSERLGLFVNFRFHETVSDGKPKWIQQLCAPSIESVYEGSEVGSPRYGLDN